MNLAIKGDGTKETGINIIKYLEIFGAKNKHEFDGTFRYLYYYINKNNVIDISKTIPIGYFICTFKKAIPPKSKFPKQMLCWNTAKTKPQIDIVFGYFLERKSEFKYIGNSRNWRYARELPISY